mmetsp:Transcript_106674/g.259083  ORF Transcript_106674/g.259083 Transcript_106674/m.259083 type:complete len:616 (+) Transcript_106674:106-1953(+)
MSSAITFAEAHLQSLVSSLGRRRDCRLRDSPYVKDPMCHETLQDILRFLRHDQSHERPVAFLLYSWDFLQTHLLPLVLTYHGSESLILDSVKLLVFLTLPADASAKNVTEQRRYISHTLENLLQRREIFPILFSCLSGPLERLESSNLQLKDDDGKTIQLFLTFIRNCLLTDERHKLCTDVKLTCHVKERIIQMLFETRVIDVLIQVAKDVRKKQLSDDSALLTEIFHLIFLSCTPRQLLRGFDGIGLKENQSGQRDTFRSVRRLSVRHSHFGGRNSTSNASPSITNRPVATSRQYFGENISLDESSVTPIQTTTLERLVELARMLVKGAINEVLLASWISIRHQQQLETESEEKALRVKSFLCLSYFFVSYIQIGCEVNEMDAPNSAGVSNLFDKEVFAWLHTTWAEYEQTKNVWGVVLVSGLVKEMFAMMTTIMSRGVQYDRFACEAVLSEILVKSKSDGLLQRASSVVRSYRTGEAPLMYLANATEVMHLGYRLKHLIDPRFVINLKDIFYEKTISNHIRLLAFTNLNSKRLNVMLLKYVDEIMEHGMENAMHDVSSLETLFAAAGDNKISAFPVPKGGISAVIVNFMNGIYMDERGERMDYKRKQFLGTIC